MVPWKFDGLVLWVNLMLLNLLLKLFKPVFQIITLISKNVISKTVKKESSELAEAKRKVLSFVCVCVITGQAGKSTTEILAYEAIKSQEVPAMTFLREWILTGTVQQFLKILDDIDRPDVRDLILNHLKERAQRP